MFREGNRRLRFHLSICPHLLPPVIGLTLCIWETLTGWNPLLWASCCSAMLQPRTCHRNGVAAAPVCSTSTVRASIRVGGPSMLPDALTAQAGDVVSAHSWNSQGKGVPEPSPEQRGSSPLRGPVCASRSHGAFRRFSTSDFDCPVVPNSWTYPNLPKVGSPVCLVRL